MKRLILFIIIIIITAAFFYLVKDKKNNYNTNPESQEIVLPKNDPLPESQPVTQAEIDSGIPLEKAEERITKKPFGIHITIQNSPVQPERFSGYHTGTDFEILPREEDIDVEVKAICDGKIIYKNSVNGYGGVIIQNCELDNEPVAVLYGHLSLAKSLAVLNQTYDRGDDIAVLGQGLSGETDGERKHLHLGIHKGPTIEYRGYVNSPSMLNDWIDFESLNLK